MPVTNMKLTKLMEVLDEHLNVLNHAGVQVTSGDASQGRPDRPVNAADVRATVDAMNALKTRAAVICQQGLLAIRVSRP